MQEPLTPEQEAQAQERAALVAEAIATDILPVARLLVRKKTKDTFGPGSAHLNPLNAKPLRAVRCCGRAPVRVLDQSGHPEEPP